MRCDDCAAERLVAFSCKGRGVCPSCNARRMVEVAAHLNDHVLPPLPIRQWVLSVPKRIRPFFHHDPALAGKGVWISYPSGSSISMGLFSESQPRLYAIRMRVELRSA